MQQVQTAGQVIAPTAQDGTLIPVLTHREAMAMTAEELRRFLELTEALNDEDWYKQTLCSLWTVKDIVAHQAAHVVSLTSFGSFMSHANPTVLRPYRKNGMSMLDAMNQAQIDLRQHYTPAELIAEIHDTTQPFLSGKDQIPGFLRSLTLPLPGLDQPRSLGYLFDLVYTRDMWMHRADICIATGRRMPLDAAHDGRMVALVIRDLAEKSRQGLHGRSAVLELTGAAGGSYRIGRSPTPEAVIEIDALAFCVLTSGREKAANILSSGRAVIKGDIPFGRTVLNFSENRVLY
ncbi:MAG: maleylpyruvate isomerase family mycothiol-dependent enzyme [Anaerolineae bacterium]|nr:maleylpyruvate isomerase family mycothiol-dependent enzyme [Anaerolineae bacterium]